ncbi:ATP synthase subunit I [Pseudorhodobacter ferrugineus]|uniref:N-ATPase subunit AtpR n=2 Tax=Pseudorhodobacter ferrugineus TaxID=77008 RepID=UPI00048D7D04|nr:ATP synthase subunit I [Pseudorhodobacter ferrugineus]
MDEWTMIDFSVLPLALILIACFMGGLMLGYAYFRALRATADLIVGGGSVLLGLGLTLGRVGFLGLGLYVAVLGGALALLAALAGVLCAKALILWQTDRGRA